MIFDCPICHNRHTVPDYYDNKDFICLNTDNRQTPKTFQQMEPIDIYTKNNFLMNRASTRVNEKRAVTILVNGQPSFRPSGDRIDQRTKTNW